MPCYTRSESQVAVDKMQPDLAALAIIAAGYQGKIEYANGLLTSRVITITEEHKAQIKRAYAAETVKATAKKFGWQTKQTGQFTYEITKNTY